MKRILLLLVCLLPLGLYTKEIPKTDTLDLGKAMPEMAYDGFGFNLNYGEGEQHLWRFSTNDSAFFASNRIMEKYGLEKIKTIGDVYLAVSSLPVAHPRHAQLAVLAALDILDFVAARKKQVPYGLDIRIGINSGSLIAGIIGVKKFAYDIWGDTVNTAARMEQSSEAGKINISENTYQLIRPEFICVHRGKVGAKHKGDMDMYFVESSIDGPAPVL